MTGVTRPAQPRRAREVTRTVATVALLSIVSIVRSASPQRDESPTLPDQPGEESSLRLVLAPVDVEPGAEMAFGVRGLPPDVLAATRGLSAEDWEEVFNVFVSGEDVTPILGAYRVTRDGVWLVPSFPPEPGVRYRAVLTPAGLAARLGEASVAARDRARLESLGPLRSDLALDASIPSAPTRVAAIYPSADEVPENLLRFYVHFTAPMTRGSVGRWIRLEDADGNAIELPFLDLAEELWDRDGRRLTILLDPGRIKLGLRPQREAGPALETGHEVSLVIDARWADASGRPLAESRRRVFRVGPPDRDAIDPSRWRLDAPEATRRDPLRVAFDEPLDHALLHRLLWIEDGAGNPIEGSIETGVGERAWSFVPGSPWQAGAYVLRVGRRLEDLAGNRVGRRFEVDLTESDAEVETRGHDETPVGLSFRVSTPIRSSNG